MKFRLFWGKYYIASLKQKPICLSVIIYYTIRFGPQVFERRTYVHVHVSMYVHNIALYKMRVHIMFKYTCV